MGLETQRLHQRAVLWLRTGFSASGEPTVGAASEVNCRWEYVTRQVPIGGQQEPVAIDAEVWVAADVPIGSLIWEGELADIGTGDVDDVYEVVSFSMVPDIKGRAKERTLLLQRYRGSMDLV